MLDRPPNRFQQYATQTPASARFQIDTTGLQQHDMVDNRAKNVVDAILEGAKAAPSERARRLTYFNDCLDLKPKAWIIKNVIAKGETSSWYGPPMGMKSAILTDIAVHVSAAIEWREHGIKDRTGVAFFAFERAALTCRRLMAYAKRDGHTDLPIAICSDLIDLLSPTCVDIVVATIGDAATHFNIPVGLAIIDTTAKGIAAGGGDEDKARDQNRMAANFKLIRERLPDIHLACIGHTGKDEGRGERGSNAKLGDIDMAVQLTGSEVKTANIVAANDQPCRLLATFAMEEVALGVDEDGERITTAILSARTFSCETKDASAGPKLTKNQQTMFSILFDAGRLTTEQWNEKAREADIGVRRKADLVDIRSALKAKGLIYSTHPHTPLGNRGDSH